MDFGILGWIWGFWAGFEALTQLGVGEIHGPAHPEQRHLRAALLHREVLCHLRGEIRDLGQGRA